MPSSRTSTRIEVARWFALSCLLHAALAWSVPAVRASHVVHHEPDDTLSFEVQVAASVTHDQAPPVARESAPPTPVRVAARARAVRAPEPAAVERAPDTTPAPVTQPAPNLSPFRIARAFVGPELFSADASMGQGSAAAPAEHAGATNESVAASLRPGAPPPAPEPKLVKTASGYQYTGVGFDVTIKRDGSFTMNNTYGAHTSFPFVPTQLPDGGWRVLPQGITSIVFLQANFDLYGYLDHLAGNDPYRSERHWFLEHTSKLREELAQKSADRVTRATVQQIWNAPGLTFQERRKRTFAAWDELSDDVVGARGRRVMEAAIRELCPASDARAFTAEELATFNAQRKSKVTFAPYESERAP